MNAKNRRLENRLKRHKERKQLEREYDKIIRNDDEGNFSQKGEERNGNNNNMVNGYRMDFGLKLAQKSSI